MPTFREIGEELRQSGAARGGSPDFDAVRKKYVAAVVAKTQRPLILYYANWLTGVRADTSIQLLDMVGMMEVCKGLPGPALDVILHSPGGTADATDSIVKYLRTKYNDIRVFVPLAAMSAATMWALSADRIVMGKHSQLGPIDPQLMLPNAQGVVIPTPARAIIDQFERAKNELAANRSFLAAWMPLMQQYFPGLLQTCQMSEDLAKRLVRDWLQKYMLRADPDRVPKSQAIADFFGDYAVHQSHGIGIDRDAARGVGVVIDDLEVDQQLQDAVLSVHHVCLHTMNAGLLKIIENSLGFGVYTRPVATPMLQIPLPMVPVQPAAPAAQPPAPAAPPQPPTPQPQPPLAPPAQPPGGAAPQP